MIGTVYAAPVSQFARLLIALSVLLCFGAAQMASAAHLAGHPPVEQSQVHAIHDFAGDDHHHGDSAAQEQSDDNLPSDDDQQPMHSHMGHSSIALAELPSAILVSDQVWPDTVPPARLNDAPLLGSAASLQERPPRTV